MASTEKAQTVPAGSDDGFVDVETESQIVMKNVGDEFTGTFVGWSETPGGIPQAHFRDSDGGTWFVNAGWDLKQKLAKCKTGKVTRMRLVAQQPIDGRDTPMNLFQVGQKP